MNSLLRMELRKALVNPRFVVSLGIGLVFAVTSAIASASFFLEHPFVNYGTQFDSPSPGSCFRNWMSLDFLSPTSTLFFWALPLLGVIPYACSFRAEIQSGYLVQIYSRGSRTSYLLAKGEAVLASGGLMALIPLLANFLLLACFLPAYMPDIYDVVYLGVYPNMLWSWLFYNVPLLYVGMYLLLSFMLSGLWALFVYALSFYLENRVAIVVTPFIGLVVIQFVNDHIYQALGNLTGLELGLFENMRAAVDGYDHNGWVILAEAVLLALGSFALARHRTARDVL